MYSSSGNFGKPLTRNFNSGQRVRKKVRVASYKDPYKNFYRQAFRILVAFVLPTIAIISIILLVNYYIATNFASPPTQSEGYIFGSVPIPAGSIPAPLDANAVSYAASEIEGVWLPTYDNQEPVTYAYLLPTPANTPAANEIDWVMTFYHQRLTNKYQWQLLQQNSTPTKVGILPTKVGDPLVVVNETTQEQQLYVQALSQYPDKSVIASLFVTAQLVTAKAIHDNPDLYGPAAKDGQLYVTYTRMYNRQKR